MRRRVDTWSQPFSAPRGFRPQGRNLDLTASDDAANLTRLFGVRAISLPDAVAPAALPTVAVRRRRDGSLAAALVATRKARRKMLELVHVARRPAHAGRAITVQPVPVKVRRV
jgi:hypothetical protein